MTTAPNVDPDDAGADAERAAGVADRWQKLVSRVVHAAAEAGRPPEEIEILLASKTTPVDVVRAAVTAGARLLGENRVQELVAKAPALADLAPTWHVIGHLQSNKVNAALAWAACVHSVDSAELAARLSRRCAAIDRDLDVMVQVNVSGETSKTGVDPADAVDLAAAVAALPRLRLVGLMTIGARSDDASVVRAGYARLRGLRDAVVASGSPGTSTATGLSMGMSGDLELAIAEGATVVRVGSAVFGPRPAA